MLNPDLKFGCFTDALNPKISNHNRLLKFLAKNLQKHLRALRSEAKQEAQYTEYGLKREPWEKYILMDSQKFLPLLLSKQHRDLVEQAIIVHFVVFSLNEGKIFPNTLSRYIFPAISHVRYQIFHFVKSIYF